MDNAMTGTAAAAPAGTAAPLVATRGLNLILGTERLHILRDINIDIAQGEVVAIVGPSGSGKTSLLMLLAGLERATSGEVRIDGTVLTGMSEDRLAIFRRKTLSIVFQSFHLIPSLNALENVSLALEIAEPERSFAEVRAAAAKALESVGLGERLTHLPSRMSGGEQQRVGLARALVTRPKLLLADEPTGNLDMDTGTRVMDLMLALARENQTTVVLITHDPHIAARADRVLTMTRGQLTEEAKG
jgi:putative ABC transport system ATP-binding protein